MTVCPAGASDTIGRQQKYDETMQHRRDGYEDRRAARESLNSIPHRSKFISISSNVGELTKIPFTDGNDGGDGTHPRQESLVDSLGVPVWSILPLHDSDGSRLNHAYAQFMHDKRSSYKSGIPAEDIVGRYPIFEVLYLEEAYLQADDLSRWAARLAYSHGDPSMEQIITFWAAWHFMRWLIMPSPQTYESVPVWLRPVPNQLFFAHNICNDFIVWPLFREAVVQKVDMQKNSQWVRELSKTTSCNWPHTVQEALTRRRDGRIELTRKAIEHAAVMDNWTVGPKFRAFMPNVDLFVRVKYTNEV